MTTPRRSRNPRGEGGRLREQILAAATELLDAGGDERAVTLRAVARRIGIAPPSIYPHFPDQQAIVRAVVRQGFADLARQLRLTAVEDPPRHLYAVCRTYLEFAQRHPHRYRAMFAANPLGAEAMAVLVESLTACVASGHCASEAPAVDAIALWLGLHGLAHQRAVANSFPWPTDITQRVAIPLARLTPAWRHQP